MIPFFAKEYVKAVNKISSEKYLNNFFLFFMKINFSRQIKILNSSFPFVQSIENRIRLAANILLESIEPPPDPFQIKKFKDSINTSTNLELLFSSNHTLPIKIISVYHNSEKWLPIKGSKYLSVGSLNDKSGHMKIVFSKDKNIISKNNLAASKSNKFIVSYKTIGSENIVTKEFEIIISKTLNSQDKFQTNNVYSISNKH